MLLVIWSAHLLILEVGSKGDFGVFPFHKCFSKKLMQSCSEGLELNNLSKPFKLFHRAIF